MVRWITIVLACVGLAVGAYAVATSEPRPPVLPLARPPSVNPFASGVAALGLVEPAGRDVLVVAPEGGLVVRVLADVGDKVEAGQPLFELDDRTLRAELLRAQASVDQAQAEIERWRALPRAEDLPPLQASVDRARAVLSDREDQLRLVEETRARGAGNDRDVRIAQFSRDAARADLDLAQASLDRARAGGWNADRTTLEALLAQRQAEVAALRILLDRLVVRAPIAGQVLRRDIDPGEFAPTGAAAAPAFILGDLSRLRVRAQVDEEDIALIAPPAGAALPALRAVARTRGGLPRELALTMLRVEPFARPKSDLLGRNTERVDTRVIDVLFELTQTPDVPLFPGQAVDVFIEARTGDPASSPPRAADGQ